MTKKTIVITGANSYLGEAVVRHLLEKTDWRIVGLVSPRWNGGTLREWPPRLRCIPADLTKPLPEPVRQALQAADKVFHFAWVRGKRLEEVDRLNLGMINSLMDAMAGPSRFYFISSVAASPGALSTYGCAKYHAMQKVCERGGVALICGLVVDGVPRGPFKMLTSVAQKLPFSIRFNLPVPVYPVDIRDVLLAVQKVGESNLSAGCYRLFAEAVDLNDFLASLEKAASRRRPAVKLDPRSLLAAASVLKLVPGLSGLAEKLQTFLHKDSHYLMSHLSLPDFSFRTIQV